MNFVRIKVGSKVGALAGFVSKPDGSIVGLSAFHVLSGSNRQIDPFDDIVDIRDEEQQKWVEFGITKEGIYSRGNATDRDFGVLDFAFFQLNPSLLERVEKNLNEIPISHFLEMKILTEMENEMVFGYSVINESRIVGQISKVFYTGSHNLFDAEIEIIEGSTEDGDSGILWKDANGRALLMHIRGNSDNNTFKSYGTFINRIIANNKLFEWETKQLA
ncbi:hypothetical protein VB776_09970 [Arcicella sp. DC2W]|uniref:Trypsin-like peptidase domain-containing protein n=1 Tax=Arcicella gelida TaxID=2984195 RepID=A0ABU5S4C5_9BACT|nr:hypothetical protein [Arcicella sp. DC2W]MEA5403241.1 hypothetical protein [Arcicella sp. DC2W]